MKKLLSFFFVVSLLWSCSPARTTVSGLENVAFVEIYGDFSKYDKEVRVMVDEQPAFTARVNKQGSNRMKPYRYEIPTGKHVLHIYSGNAEVLTETVFVSSQITKKLTLP